MIKLLLLWATCAVVGLTLSGCLEQPQQQPQISYPQGASGPMVVTQPQQDNTMQNMMLGGVMGYLLGGGGRSNPTVVAPSSTHTTIVQNRTIIKEVQVPKPQEVKPPVQVTRPSPAPVSRPAPVTRSLSTPSRSFSSGRR